MNGKPLLAAALIVLATGAAPPATAADGEPAVAGLERVESRELDEVLIAPGAEFSAWERVHLAPAEIEFRDNWLRDQNRRPGIRVREDDVEELRGDLAGLVREVFTEELERAGFSVIDAPADGALTIHPDIVELDIIAPDFGASTPGRVFQYSQSAGEMTLRLTAEADGRPVAVIRDRKRDFQQGWFEWRTQVSNRADARRWLRGWARSVSEGLARSDWSGAR